MSNMRGRREKVETSEELRRRNSPIERERKRSLGCFSHDYDALAQLFWSPACPNRLMREELGFSLGPYNNYLSYRRPSYNEINKLVNVTSVHINLSPKREAGRYHQLIHDVINMLLPYYMKRELVFLEKFMETAAGPQSVKMTPFERLAMAQRIVYTLKRNFPRFMIAGQAIERR
ncbi:Putative serine [Trichuris trichiura]|uniref:Putative serine n=1 Tax=Trichuris trichiura TaxID=36087 RepID=A0A077Z5S8_TRITR|nr:Putative serine [Trichuris trichiura]